MAEINKEFKEKYLPDTKPESKLFVELTMGIVRKINEILNQKNMTYSDLAIKMNMTEDEIHNMLNGFKNLNLHDIARLTVCIDNDIITL